MRFSPITLNLFIISGITLGMTLGLSSHVYAVENNNNLVSNNMDYHQVNLNDVSSGTLLFKQNNSKQFLQAPQLKTQVEIEINGLVANVKVKQKFTNTSNNWQHGVYAFPLPDNAAINQLKMRIGERVIVGEVQEKKQARKTFNNAKKSGKKAALIEQHRPNLFTTQLANIPPNEEVEVELNYFQQVDYQAGEFSLHFPMAITPRYQPKGSKISETHNSLPALIFQARAATLVGTRTEKNSNTSLFDQDSSVGQAQGPFIDLTVDLFSGAELAKVNSINHSLISQQQEQGHYTLKIVHQPVEKDFKLTWQYPPQTLPQILNFQQAYQNKKYGLLMVLPGLSALNENSAANKITPLRELTFVLDTSGSMAGDSLAQAKQAFKYALTSLNERDSFQLIAFNSYPTKLFQAPVLANETNKKHAWRFVSALESTGGTEIKSALDLVLNEKANGNEKLQQIVFLTDGAVGNEAEIFSDIEKRIGNKRLFTVGLGTAPNRYFMKKAAEIGRGSYQFISNHNELVKQMDRLFTKLSQPVLTDLNMSLNDPNGALLTTPNPIPDVYANEPLFLSYQVTGEQSDSLLTGIYQGKIWSVNIENYQQGNVENNVLGDIERNKAKSTKSAQELNIPPLATLWARRKIADHYRQLMLYKDTKAKDNIIELALKYHLVTPFTSLVAVEKEVSRPHHQTAIAKQLKNMLPVGQKLPSTALNWQWQFNGAICLLIMSVISLLLMPSREDNEQG